MRAFAWIACIAGCYVPISQSGDEGPSEPGFVHVTPGAAVVTMNGTRRLAPSLLTSDLAAMTSSSSFRFTSSDPDTASVDADGTIHGVAEGAVSIEVTDGSHGVAVVQVGVVTTLPSGPATLSCDLPFVFVPVGARITPAIHIADAQGTDLGLGSATLVTDPALARFEGAELVGVARGTFLLTATAAGGSLLGSCTVIVATRAAVVAREGLACSVWLGSRTSFAG